MRKMKDCFWLWSEDPGTHHMIDNGVENPFNLPGENHMMPLEGLDFFGIPNMCRVVFQGIPPKPYDNEMERMHSVREVIWSICDYGNNGRIEDPDDDVREVIRQANLHSNITGAIMDDFFTNDYHFKKYTPEMIQSYKDALTANVAHPMKLWVVIYTRDFDLNVSPYLRICDNITMWNWHSEALDDLEKNLNRLKELGGEDKSYYAGCFMWDYGNARPMSRERMYYQLKLYEKWLKSGKIKGIVFCSNCIADLGIENVEIARKWIQEHGDEELMW